jgi:PST family polysaccharide transporter
VTSIAGNLIDVGFIEAVVQRKEITQKHLATVFWIILLSGALLCLIVLLISPLVSIFFNNSEVGPLLAASSVIFLIQASGAIPSALLRRRLQFFQASMSDIGDAVGYISGALTAAFFGLGVWSLVIGNITGCIPGVTLRWIMAGWRPSILFSWKSLQDLWKFGINNVGMRIVYIVLDKLDFLIMGKYLLPATLGLYSQALKIVRIPTDSLGAIGNRIALPALSLVQDEQQRLQRGLLKGESVLAFIGIPLFTGMAIVAPELIRVLLGPQWIESTLPLRILCISGCVGILNISVPAVFLARGRPDINLKLAFVQLALLIPCLLAGVRYGAVGVAIAISAVSVFTWLIRQLFVHQVINLSFAAYLHSLKPAATASIVMDAGILLVNYLLTSVIIMQDIPLLVLEIVVGASIYLAVLKISKARVLSEIISLISEMIKPYKKTVSNKTQSNGKDLENSEIYHK